MASYPTIYTDARGSETTTILNDGELLHLQVRGIEFSGSGFDSLGIAKDYSPEQLAKVNLHRGDLCSCRIECRIPIPVHERGRERDGTLVLEFILGDPEPKGYLDREVLYIALEYEGNRYEGSGKSGWFEDELLETQARLPDGVFMKCCINCLYSDYSPYGHSQFGGMLCFRNLKSEYLKVKNKQDYWLVHNRCDRWVQETYLCSDFKRRSPGTGYRG